MSKPLDASLKRLMETVKKNQKTPEEIAEYEALMRSQKPMNSPKQLDLFQKQTKEDLAAMPNTISRSALFAPIARGKRKYLEDVKVASRKEIDIKYTGKQLDMADSDVFMIAIKELHEANLGDQVKISRYKLLNMLGKGKSGKEYVWLEQSLKRLKRSVITVTTEQYEIMVSLIDEYIKNKDTNAYYLKFNPKIIRLFDNQQYGLIDWDKRKKISKRINLTKWMQTYIASNRKGEQFISVEKLKGWCGHTDRPVRKFKVALKEAMEELKRLKIIKNYTINKRNIVTFIRL
jgi:hypothetical protein